MIRRPEEVLPEAKAPRGSRTPEAVGKLPGGLFLCLWGLFLASATPQTHPPTTTRHQHRRTRIMGATISMNELDPEAVTTATQDNSDTAGVDMVPRSLAACSTLTGELTKVFF